MGLENKFYRSTLCWKCCSVSSSHVYGLDVFMEQPNAGKRYPERKILGEFPALLAGITDANSLPKGEYQKYNSGYRVVGRYLYQHLRVT